jgi:hypothetical protein
MEGNMAVRYREALAQKEAWEQEKKAIKIQQQIHKERRKLLNPFAKISFSKWLIFFLFLNCTGLEIFTAWVTVQTIQLAFATGAIIDFSPLVTLIGLVVGEVIGYGIYSLKSVKENTKGGIVYDSNIHNNSMG